AMVNVEGARSSGPGKVTGERFVEVIPVPSPPPLEPKAELMLLAFVLEERALEASVGSLAPPLPVGPAVLPEDAVGGPVGFGEVRRARSARSSPRVEPCGQLKGSGGGS